MTAVDLHAQALAWAMDEVDKQCFGEDFGVAVLCLPELVQAPGGPRPAPGWALVLTGRNPVLGEGRCFHGPVGLPAPVEETVRKQVTDGVRQLRDLARSKLAGGSGQARPVPGKRPG